MKAKLTIYFYVALLPSIIYGYKSIPECSDDVVEIAKRGGLIERIFQPQDHEPVGMSEISFVFRGVLLTGSKRKEVAMKFTRSKNELQMYKYLDAIDNEDVEQFGIPAVYYHGTWIDNNLTMIGMSLLDKTVQEMQDTENIFEHDLNALIIVRNFILSSKYMHSRGVRHNDITLSNIMIRGQQTFIIDFNLGSKIHENSPGGTRNFASKRVFKGKERWPKEDWESFLYSISYAFGVRFEWMDFASGDRDIGTGHKVDPEATIEKIKTIQLFRMRYYLVSFADHLLVSHDYYKWDESLNRYEPADSRFPNYDFYYKCVNEQIGFLNVPKPVIFTWLVNLNNHAKELKRPDIARIEDPEKVDFRKLYSYCDSSMKTSASSSSSARNPIFSDKSEKKGKAKMGAQKLTKKKTE